MVYIRSYHKPTVGFHPFHGNVQVWQVPLGLLHQDNCHQTWFAVGECRQTPEKWFHNVNNGTQKKKKIVSNVSESWNLPDFRQGHDSSLHQEFHHFCVPLYPNNSGFLHYAPEKNISNMSNHVQVTWYGMCVRKKAVWQYSLLLSDNNPKAFETQDTHSPSTNGNSCTLVCGVTTSFELHLPHLHCEHLKIVEEYNQQTMINKFN